MGDECPAQVWRGRDATRVPKTLTGANAHSKIKSAFLEPVSRPGPQKRRRRLGNSKRLGGEPSGFEFDIDAGRQIEVHERVHRLRRGL